MELDHDFTVPVPVDQAWAVLLDVERIAPCMPGATLDSIDGDDFTGRLKVKLGAMTITYKGTARIASRDEQTRTVTIEGTGKEARGSGTASATVQATLHDEGEQTRVTVHTKLNVTGRPAQFGRGILGEVGGKLIGRFADNLAGEIGRDPSADGDSSNGGSSKPDAPARSATAPAVTKGDTGTAAPASGNGSSAKAVATPATEASAGTGAPTGQAPARTNGTPPAQQPPAANGESKAGATGGRSGDDGPAATVPAESAKPATGDGGARTSGSTGESPALESARRPVADRPGAEAIDLLEFAGPSIAKRLAPLLAGVMALWAFRRMIRRRRR